MWLCIVKPSRFGESNGRYTMFIICVVDFNVLGSVVVVSVRILVVFACDQRGVSAIFAQASPSRLGERCRVSR